MKHFFSSIRLAIANAIRYIPLLQNLVSRNLKKQYRSSVLGYIWCVLSPLLMMLILNFVFSGIFRQSISNYPVYLFSGRMMFSFITGSTLSMCRSILDNGMLMRKARIPYHIFPMANFCSKIVDFLFELIAFALVLLFTRTSISWHVVAFPLVVLEMFLFSYGLGLFLSQINTFVRDVEYMYAVFTMAWMYITPLFYAIDAMPEKTQFLITHLNPAYPFVHMARQIFLDHQWPSGQLLLMGLAWGLLTTVVGLFSYVKAKDHLILYV